MDVFIESCERAYQYICQQKHTTSKEIRKIERFKVHEWRDILFYLRIQYGVISVSGKGVFMDYSTYEKWLRR